MKSDIFIKPGIIIPESELEITTSRSGGAGGQHVNKTDTRITVRWNVFSTAALTDDQKHRVVTNLKSQLTSDGDLIVHNSTTRSQLQNKELAFKNLAEVVRKALYVPKKRVATKVSKGVKEKRLASKARHSTIKKLRSKKTFDD